MPELTPNEVPAHLPDHDLLRRFVLDTDEDAFAEIVRRHQRLVMGICKRIAVDQDDAEDAFQATFLKLVSKAGTIQNGELLASWLYRVARREAVQSARRQQKHSSV